MDWRRWQPFWGWGGDGPARARQRPRAGSICPGLGTGKAFPLSLSAHGKPRAGVGCVPRGPGRPWGGALSPFPCLGDPLSCGLGAQLSPAITHPFPTPLLGVLAQALTPQPLPHSGHRGPPACPGPPCPGVRYPGEPRGWKGSVARRGRGAAGKRNRPTVGGPSLPPAAPFFPHALKHPPDHQAEEPLQLTPTLLSGHPFISPLPDRKSVV